MDLTQLEIREFQNKIWAWWRDNMREFPWRNTTNPYFILVSEMMLQQTQASRVNKRYLVFIKRLKSTVELSEASNSDVLSLWSGLGYNRRALWLRDIAKVLVNDPTIYYSPYKLIKLKGIGKYTSYSIPIFAFNLDFATIDTNIKKTLIHEELISRDANEEEFYQLANLLLPRGKSRDWHNALMDFGAAKYSKRNYSLRTRIYHKPAFKGSTRYFRGLIIKDLIKQNPQKISYFQENYPISMLKLVKLIKKMENEGLINITDNFVHL